MYGLPAQSLFAFIEFRVDRLSINNEQKNEINKKIKLILNKNIAHGQESIARELFLDFLTKTFSFSGEDKKTELEDEISKLIKNNLSHEEITALERIKIVPDDITLRYAMGANDPIATARVLQEMKDLNVLDPNIIENLLDSYIEDFKESNGPMDRAHEQILVALTKAYLCNNTDVSQFASPRFVYMLSKNCMQELIKVGIPAEKFAIASVFAGRYIPDQLQSQTLLGEQEEKVQFLLEQGVVPTEQDLAALVRTGSLKALRILDRYLAVASLGDQALCNLWKMALQRQVIHDATPASFSSPPLYYLNALAGEIGLRLPQNPASAVAILEQAIEYGSLLSLNWMLSKMESPIDQEVVQQVVDSALKEGSLEMAYALLKSPTTHVAGQERSDTEVFESIYERMRIVGEVDRLSRSREPDLVDQFLTLLKGQESSDADEVESTNDEGIGKSSLLPDLAFTSADAIQRVVDEVDRFSLSTELDLVDRFSDFLKERYPVAESALELASKERKEWSSMVACYAGLIFTKHVRELYHDDSTRAEERFGYVHNQRNFGKEAYALVKETLATIKANPQTPLMELFHGFAEWRSGIARRQGKDDAYAYLEFKTPRHIGGFTPIGPFKDPSFFPPYSLCIDLVEKVCAVEGLGKMSYVLTYQPEGAKKPLELTEVALKNHTDSEVPAWMWGWKTLQKAPEAWSSFEALHQKILSYPLNKADPENVKNFNKLVAEAFWLGSNIMITTRGNAQYMRMLVVLWYEHQKATPPVLSVHSSLLDTIALSVPKEQFVAPEFWDSLFKS